MQLPADGHVHSEFSWDARRRRWTRPAPEPSRSGCRRSPSPSTSTSRRSGPGSSWSSPRPRHRRDPARAAPGRRRVPRRDRGVPGPVPRPHDPHRDGGRATAPAPRRGRRPAAPQVASTGSSARCTACPTGTPTPNPGLCSSTGSPPRCSASTWPRSRGWSPGSEAFATFAHIDYPVRSWPGAFDPREFEEELRTALPSLAAGGRALELNTRLPLHPTILGWWPEEGGRLLTFGSDAHVPEALATGLADAAAVATYHGFAPGSSPADPWRAVA